MQKFTTFFLLAIVAVIGYKSVESKLHLENLEVENYKLMLELEELHDEVWYSARVTDLPEDGGQWHLVVLAETKEDLGVYEQWFRDEPALANLKRQTHSHFYHKGDEGYKRYYKNYGTEFPMVYLVRADGKTAYGAKGALVPAAAKALVKVLKWGIERFLCPNCPKPKPKPEPRPQPNTPQPDTPPVVVPDKPEEEFNQLFYLLAGALGGLGGAGYGLKKHKEGM